MIDLQLLGGLDLASPNLSTNARARRRHPMVLLAIVAAAAPQPVTRDRLMALLWPESDAERASNSLRQAVHALRRDLGDGLFLPETSGGIRIDPNALRVDLWSFRDAIARNAYAEAIAAYQGPFLDGLNFGTIDFSHWLDAERALVERSYIDALDALGRDAETGARWNEAVRWRRLQAAADPCSSRGALGLLRALAAAGDKPGALAYAAVHESFLRAHLEIEPDPAVTAFVTALRQPTPPSGVSAQRAPETAAPFAAPPLAATLAPASVPPRSINRKRWTRPSSRVFAIAIGAIGLVGIGATYAMIREPAPVVALGSGGGDATGRDTATMLVACNGPACPPGPLPQPAFIVPRNQAYAEAPEATAYIAPVPDGTTAKEPGYLCCTTAVFERDFVVPRDVEYGIITIGVLADNQATVAINGVEFGKQPRILQEGNFAGRASMFATTFLPDPSGVNRLRVTLWDGGGGLGLNFRAFVRYSRSKSGDSSGN